MKNKVTQTYFRDYFNQPIWTNQFEPTLSSNTWFQSYRNLVSLYNPIQCLVFYERCLQSIIKSAIILIPISQTKYTRFMTCNVFLWSYSMICNFLLIETYVPKLSLTLTGPEAKQHLHDLVLSECLTKNGCYLISIVLY